MNNQISRNLPVPYFSQRENIYPWYKRDKLSNGKDALGNSIPNPNACKILYWTNEDEKNNPNHKKDHPQAQKPLFGSSCNITCIAMILHYLGVTELKPDDLMKLVFETKDERASKMIEDMKLDPTLPLESDIIEQNTFGRAFVNSFFNNKGVNCNVDFQFSLDNKMEKAIASGMPFILRVGTLKGKLNFETDQQLEDFLTEITIYQMRRVDMGTGFTWKDFCDDKKSFDNSKSIRDSAESTSEDKKKASDQIDEMRARYANALLAPGIGHFVVVRGYGNDEVIINDPWGEPQRDDSGSITLSSGSGMWYYYSSEHSSPFGENIKIKIDEFKRRYRDDGNSYAWFFTKTPMWDFVYPNTIPYNNKPELHDYLPCYNSEESFFGGFPARKALTWHTGIHIKGDRTPIRTIGPGQVIAARIRDSAADEAIILNGSRCFILIKHQVIVDGEIKDFFSQYYHLWPIYKLDKMLEDYPFGDAYDCPEWLEQLISRCYNRGISNTDCPVFKKSNGELVRNLSRSQQIVIKEKGEMEIEDEILPVVFFKMDGEEVFSPVDFFGTIFYSSDEEKDIYREKIEQLCLGEIAFFDDLPEDDSIVEIGMGEEIGRSGWFNGYQTLQNPLTITADENNEEQADYGKLQKMFHWEIFSNENITGQPVVEESCSSENLLNAKDVIEKLQKANALRDGIFEMLEDDGMITNEEFYNFCQIPQVKSDLANFTIKGLSEWSNKVNWETAYDKAIGFNKFGQKVAINRAFSFFSTQRYIEAFRDPHNWFNERMIEAMKPQKQDLFDEGTAYFYHPVRFLKWLLDNNWGS